MLPADRLVTFVPASVVPVLGPTVMIGLGTGIAVTGRRE